jgi:hypothetical protein
MKCAFGRVAKWPRDRTTGTTFFNALVWCTFPLAKAALNARHAAALTAQPAIRGSDRDALTHFDECGVVVVASDPSLLALLRGFQWRALFWTRRHDLASGAALLRLRARDLRALAAAVPGSDRQGGALRSDCGLAVPPHCPGNCRISTSAWPAKFAAGEHLCARALHPLPLMGLPGVTPDNETAAYYDDRGNSGRARRSPAYNQCGKSVRQPLGKRCKPRAERKVRAPQSRMPVNDRAP